MFQSMNKNLSHDFVNGVTKVDRPKMANGFWTKLFWDEGNQGLIKMLRDFFTVDIFLISNFTDSPIINQNLWKNPACRPFGPRALKGVSCTLKQKGFLHQKGRQPSYKLPSQTINVPQ